MAEMLDSQIAYSLRSEIRKKIFLQKLHLFMAANGFLEKFRVAAVRISAENFECLSSTD
jgi:hypothetical protein